MRYTQRPEVPYLHKEFSLSSSVRLFWENPYQQTFEADVVTRLDHGGQPAVILDETCFYPTSGGQPHDTGHLDGVPVVDVVEEDHEIVHVLAEDLKRDRVRGQIDWARRWDHMQQHAGQHVLSAACQELVEATTVSFHLGAAAATIDLDRVVGETGAWDRIEDWANHIVMENRAVTVQQLSLEAANDLPLRKAPQVSGLIRVVTIDGFDHSPCGGTHPRMTGEVGLIHVDRWEQHRNGTRITFLCGMRALHDYRQKSRLSYLAANRASVAVTELPEALERIQAAEETARREANRLCAKWLNLEAKNLAASAQAVGTWHAVCQMLYESDAGEMRQLATRIVEKPGMVVVLATTTPSPQFCLARSADVALDMNRVLRDLIAPRGGRGGGQPHVVQGGGLSVDDLSAVIAAAPSYLTDIA